MFICVRCKREVTSEGHFCPFCGAVAPQEGDTRDPYIGQTVAQKYFVHQLLGGGGMGQVYKATHLTLDRPVALKILKRSLLADASIVQRFHREARAASRLNHPNSITVIDFGQTEDGSLFLAMEYLAGRNLLKLIAEDFPLEPARVVKILSQALAALTEAHALGILHRDLKPENVMVESRHDETDFVKVLDFGIAKLHEPGDPSGPRLTQAGMVCGTPGYMSPEQTRGEELDARSDLYSIGVILYELLTGKLPFEADTPLALAAKALVHPPIPASERRPDLVIPPELEALAMSALSADREARPQTAEEFRRELLACAVPDARTVLAATPIAHETVVLEARRLTPRPARLSPTPAKRAASSPRTAAIPELKPRPMTPQPVANPRPPTPRAMAKAAVTPRPRTSPPQRLSTPKPARASSETDETEIIDDPGLRTRPARLDAVRAFVRSHLPLVVGSASGMALLIVLTIVGLQLRPHPGPPPPPAAVHGGEPPRQPAKGTPSSSGEGVALAQIGGPGPQERPSDPADSDTGGGRPGSSSRKFANRPEQTSDEPKKASPIHGVSRTVNSMHVPPQSSGNGLLVILAEPWANVSIDGRKIGETPLEVRIEQGTYRVRLSHPQLGGSEQAVTIAAGKREVVNAILHK